MLSRFAFKRSVALDSKATPPMQSQQSAALHSDDCLCPSSIELEDDVTSIKTNTDSTKTFVNDDAPSTKCESIVTVMEKDKDVQQQGAWSRIVPEQPPRMTILGFVDLVTVMRPRDVHSPINAILIAYISQLGLDAIHSKWYVQSVIKADAGWISRRMQDA